MNKVVGVRLVCALIPAKRRGAAASTTRDCVQTPKSQFSLSSSSPRSSLPPPFLWSQHQWSIAWSITRLNQRLHDWPWIEDKGMCEQIFPHSRRGRYRGRYDSTITPHSGLPLGSLTMQNPNKKSLPKQVFHCPSQKFVYEIKPKVAFSACRP